MSLMKIKDNNGPKTVPCGTPDVTKTSTDLTPSRTTRWECCVRKHSIHPRIELSKPCCCNFNNSRWWGTLTNTLKESMITRSICFLWSRALASSSNKMRSWVSQPGRFRKPCWLSEKMLFCSKWVIRRWYIICSRVLHGVDVSDTGR